jgi:hypothetical protein
MFYVNFIFLQTILLLWIKSKSWNISIRFKVFSKHVCKIRSIFFELFECEQLNLKGKIDTTHSIQFWWHVPKLLNRLQGEFKIEDCEKVRSPGHVPWLSALWKGRGACWSSEMGLGRIDKLQSITRTCTTPTQSG